MEQIVWGARMYGYYAAVVLMVASVLTLAAWVVLSVRGWQRRL